jgi:hypothetical protein
LQLSLTEIFILGIIYYPNYFVSLKNDLKFGRLNVTPVASWGYPVGNSTSYGGVIGLLQRGEIEIASVGVLFKTARMDFLDYAGETVRYE